MSIETLHMKSDNIGLMASSHGLPLAKPMKSAVVEPNTSVITSFHSSAPSKAVSKVKTDLTYEGMFKYNCNIGIMIIIRLVML